ncbi:MAG: S-layer homology domain-containing protein [Candidatus Peregrinibacteria bacterium]|nr:S-layer homology domain-containing protein [Candidatus Peregrinibacteria bacterium]
MKVSSKKLAFVLIAISIVGGVFVNKALNKSDYDIINTSVLGVLKATYEDIAPSASDLAIVNVVLNKESDPTENFNYYKYKASIVVKNNGGRLINARLLLRGDGNQKSVVVRNTDYGFSLAKDGTYIIKNYDVIFDGNYNGGEIPIYIDITDKTDTDTTNNVFVSKVFEGPAKIKDIFISDISPDGKIELNFNDNKYFVKKHGFELFRKDNVSLETGEGKYFENTAFEKPIGYHVYENSLKNLEADFDKTERTEENSHYVKFSEHPYGATNNHYVFVKATNPENGYYGVSDIIKLGPQTDMNRAQFVKAFVDYLKISLAKEDMLYYTDVSPDEWYAPYVKTVYNLGLLNTASISFSPEKKITRGDVLKLVMDYFEADLTQNTEKHFKDIDESSPIYPYAQSFLADGKASGLGSKFAPDLPATQDFIKNIIDEYRKNN